MALRDADGSPFKSDDACLVDLFFGDGIVELGAVTGVLVHIDKRKGKFRRLSLRPVA